MVFRELKKKLSTKMASKTVEKPSFALSYPLYPPSLHKIMGITFKKANTKVCFVKIL